MIKGTLGETSLLSLIEIKCPTQCISIVSFPKTIFEHATFVDVFHYIYA
jgi:hypothetical protein